MGKRQEQGPLRRVVDDNTDEEGNKLDVLECGHELRAEKYCRSKPGRAHRRCGKCAEEGRLDRPKPVRRKKEEKPRYCVRCGCKLNSLAGVRNKCFSCGGGFN